MKPPLRRLVGPAIATAVMLALLLGLGVWQVRRLAWKEALLARLAAAEAGPATPLSAKPSPWSKVAVSGTLRPDLAVHFGDQVHDGPSGPHIGSQLIVPLIRAHGAPVLVDVGWVPDGAHPALPTGEVRYTGYVRPASRRSWLGPDDNLAQRHFYTLDPGVIGRTIGLPQVRPLILVATGPAGTVPDPAQHFPQPPNNHLSYAITWFSLAAALAVVFALHAARTLKEG